MALFTRRRLGVVAVLALIVLAAVGLEFYEPPVNATLKDINSKEDLQSLFNQDSGSTRVILLISPT